MSRLAKGDDVTDVLKAAGKNPKVDAEKVSEVRELSRILRDRGVSRQGYDLIPPFRRQMHVESRHGKTEG